MFSLWWILFGILLDGEEDNNKKKETKYERKTNVYTSTVEGICVVYVVCII